MFINTPETRALIGLGLALCKDIVEADGGKISIESRPGEGTTVQVYIEEQRSET